MTGLHLLHVVCIFAMYAGINFNGYRHTKTVQPKQKRRWAKWSRIQTTRFRGRYELPAAPDYG